jgi:hypothetical protein
MDWDEPGIRASAWATGVGPRGPLQDMEWLLPYGSQRRNGLQSCQRVHIEPGGLRRWEGLPNQRVVEGSRDAKVLGNVHVCESLRISTRVEGLRTNAFVLLV